MNRHLLLEFIGAKASRMCRECRGEVLDTLVAEGLVQYSGAMIGSEFSHVKLTTKGEQALADFIPNDRRKAFIMESRDSLTGRLTFREIAARLDVDPDRARKIYENEKRKQRKAEHALSRTGTEVSAPDEGAERGDESRAAPEKPGTYPDEGPRGDRPT